MANTTANGLTIEYETTGDPSDPPLLLVMGLGGQLIYWPDAFCRALADHGFFVVRYDNRDVGLSSKIEGGSPPDLFAALLGEASPDYTLADMAADGIALLDALGLGPAHVVGVSMGGMIAQHMAFGFPGRVESLCSIMSSPTGVMAADPPTNEANLALLRPAPRSREEAIEASVAGARAIGSPGFPFREEMIRQRAGMFYDRCFYPAGPTRQLIAILSAGDWRDRLAGVTVPVLVIHGDADPLVRPSWGRATAEAVPGAELLLIAGMGHDLPEDAWPVIVDAIVANIKKAV